MDQTLFTVGTAFLTTLATKGAEAPANTFNNIWTYVFSPIDNYLIKKNAVNKQNLDNFLKDINNELSQVEAQNIQKPKTSILGPALEASKYYIEEDEIRKLFAKVIAASFDSSKNSVLHHSFVEIIKQLSPLDAKIIKSLPEPFYLIACSVQLGSTKHAIVSGVVLNDEFSEINFDTAISTSNLSRLGLIEVNNNLGPVKINASDEEIINRYKHTTHYMSACSEYGSANIDIFSQPGHITNLGLAFKEICCSD